MILFIIIAGLFKALQDKEVQNGDVNKSWKRKYKLDAELNLIPYVKKWYYFGLYTPKYQEAFPYSTTFLVALTDRWHLYGSIKDLSLITLISYALYGFGIKFILGIIVLRTIMLLTFNIIFNNNMKELLRFTRMKLILAFILAAISLMVIDYPVETKYFLPALIILLLSAASGWVLGWFYDKISKKL